MTLAGDALHPMTPNLGQGGCTALEDALVLGRSLQQAGAPALAAGLQDSLAGGSTGSSSQRQQQQAAAAVREAIGRYERERTQRCLPLTIRSHLMGAALQVGHWAGHSLPVHGRLSAPYGNYYGNYHTNYHGLFAAWPVSQQPPAPAPPFPSIHRSRTCLRWCWPGTCLCSMLFHPPTSSTMRPTTAGGCRAAERRSGVRSSERAIR